MAAFFLRVKSFGRGRGGRATRAAAYRAGERIRDERTSDVYNYSARDDVLYKEIILPSQFADPADLKWAARDRATLWNAAEHAGRQRNSLLAREVLVILPWELLPAQRIALMRGFAQELAERYRNAIDIAIHAPRPGADRRHYHAHLLMTTREVTPEGLGARTILELSGRERQMRGLGARGAERLAMRERWAQHANEALREAGVAARIDHRSYREQGIDRTPAPVIPQSVYYAERKSGARTPAGDAIRAQYHARAGARRRGISALAEMLRWTQDKRRQPAVERVGGKSQEPAVQRTSAKRQEHAVERASGKAARPKRIRRSALTREELNEKRRERQRANAEKLNAARRERYKASAVTKRAKYRQWRAANADQVNERRTQWRKANVGWVNRRQREYYRSRIAPARAAAWLSAQLGREVAPDPANLGAMEWLRYRARQESAGAERAADPANAAAIGWLRYRGREESAGTEQTAEQAAKNWLAYLEGQEQTRERPRGSANDNALEAENRNHRGRGRGRDRGQGRSRDRDNDFTL
jgi:MobA/MobL family